MYYTQTYCYPSKKTWTHNTFNLQTKCVCVSIGCRLLRGVFEYSYRNVYMLVPFTCFTSNNPEHTDYQGYYGSRLLRHMYSDRTLGNNVMNLVNNPCYIVIAAYCSSMLQCFPPQYDITLFQILHNRLCFAVIRI